MGLMKGAIKNPVRGANAKLVRFRDHDTPNSLSRESLAVLAERLGLTETATIQLALRQLFSRACPELDPMQQRLRSRQTMSVDLFDCDGDIEALRRKKRDQHERR